MEIVNLNYCKGVEMESVNKVWNLKKNACISIFGMLIRYFYVNYYLLNGEDALVKGNGLIQLYFGGLLIEQSFDIIAVSLQMLIIILETVVLVSDLHNGLLENLDILVCRVTSKSILYKNFLGQVLIRNIILVIFNYVLFMLFEKTEPSFLEFSVLVIYFLQIILLELVYFTIDFTFKIVYGYVFMLLIYFAPIIFVGFMYANGSNLWQMGKTFFFHYIIFNWFHGLEVKYTESDIEWETISLTITSSNNMMNSLIQIFVPIILVICLYTTGKIYFQKSEII